MTASVFSGVAPGQVAAVVTTLEMRRPPAGRRVADGDRRIARHPALPLDRYRDLYRRVGQDWLWFSRLVLPDAALAAIIHHPEVEVWTLDGEDGPEGLLELDFREPGACELSFLGLTRRLIGTGAGRWLMDRAVERAWSRPITRFWVHTCTLDHPAALGFYQRSGFVAVGRQIEVADDPRFTGVLPRAAAPQVPML